MPCLCAGMAGSGKTTLIQRINSHMHQHKLPGYIINLDPAVTHLPYGANIDIRDTVRVNQEVSYQPNTQLIQPPQMLRCVRLTSSPQQTAVVALLQPLIRSCWADKIVNDWAATELPCTCFTVGQAGMNESALLRQLAAASQAHGPGRSLSSSNISSWCRAQTGTAQLSSSAHSHIASTPSRVCVCRR